MMYSWVPKNMIWVPRYTMVQAFGWRFMGEEKIFFWHIEKKGAGRIFLLKKIYSWHTIVSLCSLTCSVEIEIFPVWFRFVVPDACPGKQFSTPGKHCSVRENNYCGEKKRPNLGYFEINFFFTIWNLTLFFLWNNPLPIPPLWGDQTSTSQPRIITLRI